MTTTWLLIGETPDTSHMATANSTNPDAKVTIVTWSANPAEQSGANCKIAAARSTKLTVNLIVSHAIASPRMC
jgi:hypothetical protein